MQYDGIHGTQNLQRSQFSNRSYVSCIDFDSKGIYLASLSSTGCLAIHEFETLCCNAAKGSDEELAIFTRFTLGAREAVKWNPTNQDEVACVAALQGDIYVYNIACDFTLPSEVLKSNIEVHGLQDISICKNGSSRFLACGRGRSIPIWDRRAGTASNSALPVPQAAGTLNSIQLSNDEQVVYAGSERGFIYAWDLRGGTQAAAFVSCGEVYHPPFSTVKVATLLSDISSLRAQTEIEASAVHAISLDSFGNRLGFHLNSGWSGVLDFTTMDISHLHCPPPCFDETEVPVSTHRMWIPKPDIRKRRPAWLLSFPVFAVGSTSQPQIHMLDFAPNAKSRQSSYHECSHGFCCDQQRQPKLCTSEAVVALAAHPLNDQLVAGTQGGRLLLVDQKASSFSGEVIKSLVLDVD